GLWAQERLLQTGGGQRAPGDSVFLSCQAFGFRLEISGVRWYRQTPGSSLEWVSVISSDSSVIDFAQPLQGRAKVSRDNSRFESSLSIRALQPQDSARYFCVVAQ
ncbi:HV03 protein, partial [Rhinopomastus cyanomelas]|nr:HV03 protein [Rhinopomastus cyanomelas]